VRQVHYLLVETPEAHHPNTINGYQKASRILTNMRYGGLLDWNKIVDETRDVYKETPYANMNEAVESLLDRYRRDRWRRSRYYVKVWVEKRTLVNLFYPITDKFDIHLASGGGFSSATYVYEAIRRLYPQKEKNKEIVVLYFGDLDPSGAYMSEDIEERFREWGIDLEVKRICLNAEHLDEYKLPKKFDVKAKKGERIYNKIAEDPRAKWFYRKYGELFQVELEALDPRILNEMLTNAISEYVDMEEQTRVQKTERSEITRIRTKLGLLSKS